MILDYLSEFCKDTAVPTSIGSAQVGASLDMGSTVTRLGEDASKQMHVYIQVTETFTSGGSATVTFNVMSDAQDPITPASATHHMGTAAIPVAQLTAGTLLKLTFPMKQGERYYGLAATVATAALTAGKVSSGLLIDPHGTYAYPDAVN